MGARLRFFGSVLVLFATGCSSLECPEGASLRTSDDGWVVRQWCAAPNGAKHGVGQMYEQKVLVSHAEYLHGKRHGFALGYDRETRAVTLGRYENDVKQGPEITIGPSFQETTHYEKGVPEGPTVRIDLKEGTVQELRNDIQPSESVE